LILLLGDLRGKGKPASRRDETTMFDPLSAQNARVTPGIAVS
jgi:hypothetical protein